MAKNWYPVIDESKCVQCLECVAFCPHGVFEERDGHPPAVVAPEECVEFCRACEKLCDAGAISFAGETAERVRARAEAEAVGAREGGATVRVTVYGPGCAKCQKLEERARQAVQQAGVDAEVAEVSDISEMAKAGVLMTPALAINGKLVVSGKVPAVAEIVTAIINAAAAPSR